MHSTASTRSPAFDKLNGYKFPPYWEDTFKQVQPGGQNIVIKDVEVGSDEWKEIESNFKKTMPSSQVTQIERIQNKRLWRTF